MLGDKNASRLTMFVACIFSRRSKMQAFDAIPKQWGNSIGITIPREVIEKEKISPKRRVKFLVVGTKMDNLKKAFGSLKLKKETQKVMDEIDAGYD